MHVCDSENFSCWISFVKQLLNNLGFGYTCKWDCQECFNESLFLHELKQRLNDWFILEAHSFFESSLKCNLYTYLNKSFQLQPYLRKSISEIQTQYISKYRLFVHQLELERGRFFNIDRSEKICTHCSLGNVEDDPNFILICPFYERIREKHIKKYYYKKPFCTQTYSIIIILISLY